MKIRSSEFNADWVDPWREMAEIINADWADHPNAQIDLARPDLRDTVIGIVRDLLEYRRMY